MKGKHLLLYSDLDVIWLRYILIDMYMKHHYWFPSIDRCYKIWPNRYARIHVDLTVIETSSGPIDQGNTKSLQVYIKTKEFKYRDTICDLKYTLGDI